MGEWIKYDGTNKPECDASVRIRHDPEIDPSGVEWDSRCFLPANAWAGWQTEEGNDKPLISHFMIDGGSNDPAA